MRCDGAHSSYKDNNCKEMYYKGTRQTYMEGNGEGVFSHAKG